MASSSDASSSDTGGHHEGVYYHKKFKLLSCVSEPAGYESAALRPHLAAAVGWEPPRQPAASLQPPPPEPPSTDDAALKAARRAGKYQCTFCGNFFAKPSVLDKHIRSHTNERPFSCAVCKYSFKTKSNFVKHCKTRKHAARSAGGDGGDLPSDEEVSGSESSEPEGDAPSETDSWAALDLAPAAAERVAEPPPAAARLISHSIDHIIGRSEEADSPPDPPGSPGAKGVVSHIDKVIQLNEAQLSITKRALDNFGRHSTTLGRERETVRRVASTEPAAAGRRGTLLPRSPPAELAGPPPSLGRRSSVIGVEHDAAPAPSDRPRHPPALLRSSFSVPGAAEEPPLPGDSLQFTAMPSLLEARCVGCGLSHPGPCPLLSDGGPGAAGGHILKRHLLSSAAGSPQLKRRRLSPDAERLVAVAARYEPLAAPTAAAPPGGRSPFEERKSLSYMGGGQVMVNETSERRTYRVNQPAAGTSAGGGFYVSSPPASAAPRETSPQVMTIKSNLNSGGKMIEMSGSSDSGSGGSQLGTPRLTGSAPPLQHNPFHFNKPISSMFTGSFYPAIQAPNIAPQLGPILLPPSPSRTGAEGGSGGRTGGREGAGKRFCPPRSPSGLLSVPGQPSQASVVALPSTTRAGGKNLKLTIQIPRPHFPSHSSGTQTAPVTVPAAAAPAPVPVPAAAPAPPPVPSPAPAPRSPAMLQPPVSPAPRRSPGRPVPHVPGMPGPYSAASDVPPRIERPPPPPPPPARPPPKIQVQAADDADSAPSKPGGSLPRPSSLPLQPVQYVNKSQRGAALYSPETPRPKKAIQQTHMNGKCYTYIGHKSSTKLYFCSLFQPQPNYVEQKCGHQVSMYSQWKHAEPPADGVPVTRALTTLRLSVNRGSGGRLSFVSAGLGPGEPRLSAAGPPQPRLCPGRPPQQVTESGRQRSARCTCSRLPGRPSAPCVSCSDRCDASSSDQRERYPSDQRERYPSSGGGRCQSRLLGTDLSVRAARNGRPPGWGGSWEGDERHRSSSPRHRRLSTASGSAEDLAAAEALVTFRGGPTEPDEQEGPIDLSVGRAGSLGADTAPPRRPAADPLRPLAPPEQLALMYAALSRLESAGERPAPLRLPPAAQRYTLELELSAKQRRLSAEPVPGTGAAGDRVSPELREEAEASPQPLPQPQPQPQLQPQPPEHSRRPMVVEEIAEEKPPPPAPPPLPASPTTAADTGSEGEVEIDVVSPGEEARQPAPAEGNTAPGGMQAILKDIFNQVRHERASAGFSARPEQAAGAASEPTGAPSLMHPNVTAGQPGLALTRPTQRAEPTEQQHSDSSFFNRNSDRLVCTVCNKRDFVNRNQLSAHTKTHQMDQRRFRCEVCETSFRSEQQLNKHRKSNDHLQKANIHRQFGKPQGDRRIYECLFCMRGFHNIGTLHKHFRCKTHIMGLENAGWLPCGTYAELEALGVPGRTDGADSINVEGTWPNYCHLQELSLTLLRDRLAEMADWRRKFDDIRRGRPPRSYPFEIDPKLRGNADPSRPRPQFPADFFRAPPANGSNNDSTNVASSQQTYRPAGGGGGGVALSAPLKQEQMDDEPAEPPRLNGQSY